METLYLIGGLICGYLIYAKGIADGIKLEKGHRVTIVPNPVKALRKNKEAKKEDKAEAEKIEEINNLMGYTGFKQKAGD